MACRRESGTVPRTVVSSAIVMRIVCDDRLHWMTDDTHSAQKHMEFALCLTHHAHVGPQFVVHRPTTVHS